MESLTIKLDEQMLKKIDKMIKENNYGTRTEFVRSALREKMTQLEKEDTIKQILALKGSVKTKTSYKELRRIRQEASEEYLKMKGLK